MVKYTVGKLTKIKTNVYNIIKNECKKIGIIGAIVSATLTGVIIYSTIAITKKLQIKSE